MNRNDFSIKLIFLSFLILIFSFASISSAQTAQTALLNAICNVFNTVKNVIFILGLTLMILGGTIYAGGNVMPARERGQFQGYGVSLIMGGIIGVAIAVAAPWILNIIIQANPNAITATTSSLNLNNVQYITIGTQGITAVCEPLVGQGIPYAGGNPTPSPFA
jgi:hypothetical protein